MYKKDLIISFIIVILFLFFSYKIKFKLNSEVISNLITLLSLLFGFLLTSLSIMITSNKIRALHRYSDPENNNITHLHRLANYYRDCVYLIVCTIIYLLAIQIFNFTEQFSFLLPSLLFLILYYLKLIFGLILDVFKNKTILKQ